MQAELKDKKIYLGVLLQNISQLIILNIMQQRITPNSTYNHTYVFKIIHAV